MNGCRPFGPVVGLLHEILLHGGNPLAVFRVGFPFDDPIRHRVLIVLGVANIAVPVRDSRFVGNDESAFTVFFRNGVTEGVGLGIQRNLVCAGQVAIFVIELHGRVFTRELLVGTERVRYRLSGDIRGLLALVLLIAANDPVDGAILIDFRLVLMEDDFRDLEIRGAFNPVQIRGFVIGRSHIADINLVGPFLVASHAAIDNGVLPVFVAKLKIAVDGHGIPRANLGYGRAPGCFRQLNELVPLEALGRAIRMRHRDRFYAGALIALRAKLTGEPIVYRHVMHRIAVVGRGFYDHGKALPLAFPIEIAACLRRGQVVVDDCRAVIAHGIRLIRLGCRRVLDASRVGRIGRRAALLRLRLRRIDRGRYALLIDLHLVGDDGLGPNLKIADVPSTHVAAFVLYLGSGRGCVGAVVHHTHKLHRAQVDL